MAHDIIYHGDFCEFYSLIDNGVFLLKIKKMRKKLNTTKISFINYLITKKAM